MKRSVKQLKNLWRKNQAEVDKLMLKVGTCHESGVNGIVSKINALKREKSDIEDEMYGDWAPLVRRYDDDDKEV